MIDSYIYQINQIDAELKRLNAQAKALRAQKKIQTKALYNIMRSQGLEKVGEGKKAITIQKCERVTKETKKAQPLKPKKQRRKDEINLLREQGVPNPEMFYEELERIRRPMVATMEHREQNEISVKSKKGKSKNQLDDLLGF